VREVINMKGQKKVRKVMREFKAGTLHSGKGGKVVKSRKQAVAIALSEAGMSKRGRRGR
jgi:ribosomal protein L21E